MGRLRVALRGRGGEGGYTLVELLAVVAILTTVLAGLTALFVSGAKAELELNKRFQAQQNARLALEKMRREVHCASRVEPSGGGVWTAAPVASIDVTLPAYCPAAAGVETTIRYASAPVAAGRHRITRTVGAGAAVTVADHVTSATPFSYDPPRGDSAEGANDGSLGRLHVDFPVNVDPDQAWKQWRLVDDIVLRNTQRVAP